MTRRPPNEWEFQGEVLGWLNEEIARRPGMKLDRATQEPSRINRKRNDLVVWWNRATEAAFLTVELKKPNTPISDPVFFADADEKAKRWNSPFFALWNMQSAELYNSPVGRPANPSDLLLSIYLESRVTTGEEWLDPAISKELRAVAVELLDRAWQRHAAPEGHPVPIDASVFVDRLAGRVAEFRKYIEPEIKARAAANRKIRQQITQIAAEQGFIGFVDDIDVAIAGQYAYRLIGQIVFYFALRRKQPALPALELRQGGRVPDALRPYWDQVRRFDYEALFQPHHLDALVPVPPGGEKCIRSLIEELKAYDWADLREDILGSVFENLIPRSEQVLLGQFYTPFPVADILVAFSVSPRTPVLDPACGSGTFLMRAYDFVRSRTKSSHSEVLQDLWGFDISPFAAELAAINLFRQDLATFDNFPRIVPGSFFDRRVGEELQFPPAKTGGPEKVLVPIPRFNSIVGNPPYVRSQNQDDLSSAYKRTLFNAAASCGVSAEAKTDLFAFFVYQTLHFLEPGGRLGFVISASWLTADYGRTLQRFLLDQFELTVISSSAESFFSTVDVNTVLILAERTRSKEAAGRLRFVTLKRALGELVPALPHTDYWDRVVRLTDSIEAAIETFESGDFRVVVLSADRERRRLTGSGKSNWSRYLRAPLSYFELFGDVA